MSYLGGFFEGFLLLFFMEKIPSKKGVATLGVPSFFLAQRSNRVAAVSSSLKFSEILAVSKSKSWPVHLYTKSWAGLRDVCIFLDAFPYEHERERTNDGN